MEDVTVQDNKTYVCKQVQDDTGNSSLSAINWEAFEALELVETVTGIHPKERTEVRICWSRSHLHIRFRCSDSYAHSTFTKRDDPLYEQDVVEMFIDETGAGTRYMELEISPNNIVFDALVTHDGEAVTNLDLAWRFEGMTTSVERLDEDILMYFIHIPVENFKLPIEPGVSWRVNFYRIDEDEQGFREFQAWQPTGAINYHLPSKFGRLTFV
ncbi:hypothetical protein BK133_03095 [Paenibacillus sp. FSL H8-0548]|uniref:carbohydrate-binding family 9-like protein n=1 Tax=Paenibacillus sp. FSL H8-0548 TaxID=1920422 RepID=UPI00096C670C|nr:carbohydrate-binding family 9-like protein [Paenibacillus sp. FSL H8-0548]OMF37985.1 hypothetical protein BK133_03095 [Paenibacillus sp. FSL H8-0548]